MKPKQIYISKDGGNWQMLARCTSEKELGRWVSDFFKNNPTYHMKIAPTK